MNSILRDTSPPLDKAKLKALVHYVVENAPNPKRLGKTKLNKILFYSDMEAYLEFGRPISGEEYVKFQFGPVSKHIEEIVTELEREDAIAVARIPDHSHHLDPYAARYQYFALRSANIAAFSAPEIKIVDAKIKAICSKTATAVSRQSHDLVWESAEMGELIPYYTVFAGLLRKPRPDAVEWARERIAERGGAA